MLNQYWYSSVCLPDTLLGSGNRKVLCLSISWIGHQTANSFLAIHNSFSIMFYVFPFPCLSPNYVRCRVSNVCFTHFKQLA